MIIVYDTETTGLTLHPKADVHKQPRIIEFGAVLLSMDDGDVADEINILIYPEEEITPEITKITGITNDDVAGAPNFAAAYRCIHDFFCRATTVMAHNLPFDKAMVMNELKRMGVADFPWPECEICTVGLYKDGWGRNPKLKELYQHILGKPLEQTHRALDDVYAMVEIIQHERLWEFAR